MNRETLLKAIDAIYDAALQPDKWPHALQAIANHLGDVGAALLWHREDGNFGGICSPSLTAVLSDYTQNWSHRDKDIRSSRGLIGSYFLSGEVASDYDILTQQEIDSDPFYTEFLASHGLKWFASVGISPDTRITAAISVQRYLTKASYSQAERDELKILGRHAEKALRLGIRLIKGEFMAEELGDALRRLDVAVFALDDQDRVLFRNGATDDLVLSTFAISHDRLIARVPEDRGRLRAALGELSPAAESFVHGSTPLILQKINGGRVAAFVLPMRVSDNISEEFLKFSRKLVLAIELSADRTDPAILRDLFGLTLGEARVASIVGQGTSPRDAAERLGITEETTRTVLKRVFSKIGVSRQSELTAMITKIAVR